MWFTTMSYHVIFQVMHGGLFSRDDVTLDEIRKIDRNRQPPEQGKNTWNLYNISGNASQGLTSFKMPSERCFDPIKLRWFSPGFLL
jgi:hypothetical protein